MKRILLTLTFLALPLIGGNAMADTVVQTAQTRAELIAEHGSVAPGQSVWVALSLDMKTGWHTYWRTPGDSGSPASITWKLPEGVTAGPIEWPTPERIPFGGLMSYGYEGKVALLTELKVDASFAGSELPIAAEATWLVCADLCIPEDGSFTLPLKVGADIAQQSSAAGALIAATREHLPGSAPWPVKITRTGAELTLNAGPGLSDVKTAAFFPYQEKLLLNAEPQTVRAKDGAISLRIKADKGADKIGEADGVLRVENTAGAVTGYVVGAPIVWTAPEAAGGVSLGMALLLALAGGLILNVMPCVLPVLFMKALSFTKHSHDAAALRRDGLAYTAGVLAAFTALVGVLIGLRTAGNAVGWGFQLQSPAFVAVMTYVILALGLNLSGVFTIGGNFGAGQSLTSRGGLSGAFFTGLLAVVVATPCTAPFMGAAMGFALTQPPAVTILVFEALGLGLALPYLALTFIPGTVKILPRPGAWMERFKQVLAFPMYGVVAWLTWVLTQQLDAPGLAVAFAGLVLIGFAAWLWGVAQASASRTRHWALASAAVVIVIAAGAAFSLSQRPMATAAAPGAGSASSPSEPYSASRLAALRAEGRPVLINFTAAWCITCMVNDRVALSTQAVGDALKRRNVAYLKADWTNRDADIGATLRALGRDGVPLYVLYSPTTETPTILPQILTPAIVVDALGAL